MKGKITRRLYGGDPTRVYRLATVTTYKMPSGRIVGRLVNEASGQATYYYVAERNGTVWFNPIRDETILRQIAREFVEHFRANGQEDLFGALLEENARLLDT